MTHVAGNRRVPSELWPVVALSSLLDLAIRKLRDDTAAQVERVRAFRATVAGQSSGMVQIKRLHSASAETALCARLEGWTLETGDEILCEEVNGFPVVLGPIQRATPTRPGLYRGSGSPEGVVTAVVGSVYLRSDGSDGTTQYNKVSGSGNTGWAAPSGGDWQFGTVMRSMAPDADTTGFGIQHSLTHGYQDFFNTQSIAFDANSPGCWALYNTSAVANNDAGMDLNGTNPLAVRTNWAPLTLEVRYQSGGTLTSGRWWIGLFSGSVVASSDPAVHGCGFRYDTGADGTAFWRCWSNDGSGGGTVTTTTVAVASHTAYTFRIDVTSTSEIQFYIDGALVATHTTNLPSATTSLTPHVKVRTLDAAVKSVRWAWLHIRYS